MDEKNYYVYKHTSPNGKVYIGITQQKPSKRWGSGANYDYNTHFINAIRKYGWHNFTHEILYEGISREEALEREKELIQQYDSSNRHKGYNVSPGGYAPGKETAAKIKDARERKGISEKESERMKQRWADPVLRENTIKNMRGKKRSDESKERYRQATLRRGSPSPESIEKMRATLRTKTGEKSIRKRPVLQIAPVTLEVVGRYWTAREAAIAVGASKNGIATVCRKTGNEHKASRGFFWCYEDEYSPELFEKYRGIQLTSNGTISRKGETRPYLKGSTSFLGKHHTDEAKEKMSKVHSKPIRCVETNTVYKSIREAAKVHGCCDSAIGKCLTGKAKTSCGFHWEYIDVIGE